MLTPNEQESLAISNGSAEEQNNSPSSEQLTEFIPIQDTPFTAVRIEDKYFLVMGKYRLTDAFKTFEEIEQDTTIITWNRLVQVMALIARHEIESHTPKNH